MANSYVCRRLILLLDGTWNDDEEDLPATNIVYMRELSVLGPAATAAQTQRTTVDKEDYRATARPATASKAASGLIFDGFEYVVYYGRGVGTGSWLDRLTGGAFGIGLDEDIRRAYKFLSFWFRPGDEIFVFGFSRGAFTARSLCGYLHAVGLLRCEHCTDRERKARLEFLSDAAPGPAQRRVGVFSQAARPAAGTTRVHDARRCASARWRVFDTVGALGVPGNLFRRANRVEVRIPRHRREFERRHPASRDGAGRTAAGIRRERLDQAEIQAIQRQSCSPTEQVWFPGAHGDVGGGYVKWNKPTTFGLSHLPLVWMMQRLNYHLAKTPPAGERGRRRCEPTIEPRRNAPDSVFHAEISSSRRRVQRTRSRQLDDGRPAFALGMGGQSSAQAMRA